MSSLTPEQIQEADGLALAALNAGRATRKVFQFAAKVAGGCTKAKYTVTTLHRRLDKEGLIEQACAQAKEEVLNPFIEKEKRMQELVAAAESGKLLEKLIEEDKEPKTALELQSLMVVLGMPVNEAVTRVNEILESKVAYAV